MRLRLGRSRNEDEVSNVSKVDSETLFSVDLETGVRGIWVVEGHPEILVTH